MLKKLLSIIFPALITRLILSAVSDRGASAHAKGTVSGSTYTVAGGDTFWSIGQRFGLPYEDILRENNLPEGASVGAGHKLKIPGLQPTVPPLKPPVKPPTNPPPTRPYLFISSPTPGSTLNPRYTVIITGTAGNVPGGQVVVRVKDPRGITLISKSTTPDSSGRWRVDFSDGLPVHPGSSANIEAEAPGTTLRAQVNVTFR